MILSWQGKCQVEVTCRLLFSSLAETISVVALFLLLDYPPPQMLIFLTCFTSISPVTDCFLIDSSYITQVYSLAIWVNTCQVCAVIDHFLVWDKAWWNAQTLSWFTPSWSLTIQSPSINVTPSAMSSDGKRSASDLGFGIRVGSDMLHSW